MFIQSLETGLLKRGDVVEVPSEELNLLKDLRSKNRHIQTHAWSLDTL